MIGVAARPFSSKFHIKGDNSVQHHFFDKSRKFLVGQVSRHMHVKFHIPISNGYSTVMVQINNDYIGEITKRAVTLQKQTESKI